MSRMSALVLVDLLDLQAVWAQCDKITQDKHYVYLDEADRAMLEPDAVRARISKQVDDLNALMLRMRESRVDLTLLGLALVGTILCTYLLRGSRPCVGQSVPC